MKNITIILLIICIAILYAAIYWFNVNYVLTPETISVIYEGVINGDSDIAQKIQNSTNQFWIIGTIVTIITAIGKILLIALIVHIGYYLKDKQQYKSILMAVVGAESVNIISALVKYINLAFINPPVYVSDMSIMPFSLLSFFDAQKLDQWMLLPLNSVNFFEFLYIFLLSFLLSKFLKHSFGYACTTVLLSYGLAMVMFIVCSSLISLYATT